MIQLVALELLGLPFVGCKFGGIEVHFVELNESVGAFLNFEVGDWAGGTGRVEERAHVAEVVLAIAAGCNHNPFCIVKENLSLGGWRVRSAEKSEVVRGRGARF